MWMEKYRTYTIKTGWSIQARTKCCNNNPRRCVCIVEAKLLLKDRGYVKVGQKVKIKLNNIDSMNYAPINGEIVSISLMLCRVQTGNYYVIDVAPEKQQFVSRSPKHI